MNVEVYALFLATITVVFLFFIVLQAVTRGRSNKSSETKPPALNAALLGQKINTRSFLIVNISLLFLIVILLLIPAVSSFKYGGEASRIFLLRELIFLIVPVVILYISLVYLRNKGDLTWLKTFRKK